MPYENETERVADVEGTMCSGRGRGLNQWKETVGGDDAEDERSGEHLSVYRRTSRRCDGLYYYFLQTSFQTK
jgi:hypothetical protein